MKKSHREPSLLYRDNKLT